MATVKRAHHHRAVSSPPCPADPGSEPIETAAITGMIPRPEADAATGLLQWYACVPVRASAAAFAAASCMPRSR